VPEVTVAVIVFAMDDAGSPVLSPELESVKSNDWTVFTISEKDVVRVTPPPAAMTVIG
jgi:hypothetical protein